MEGQAQDTNVAQPQKFQRYRSVRRAPKQNAVSNALTAAEATLMKSVSTRSKNAEGASTSSETAVPIRQGHIHADQMTAAKRSPTRSEGKRTRPQGIVQAPTYEQRREGAERGIPTKATSVGDRRERTAPIAAIKASSSRTQRTSAEHTASREEKSMDIAQPGFDAPRSAVNAGDRHVYVTCNKSAIAFPVTPSTTVLELIHAAATAMPLEKMDPTSAVLWEDYQPFLLERPLRRYETIREVMNSWDGDEQNKLLLTPSQSGSLDESLDFQYVRAQQPGESTYFMYHTHKNARWSKRIVKVHADGQVTINKEGAKEKEQQNICHLSDFDVYHISPRYQKVIRPPRPICFGVKSQQKRAVFHLNEDNFMQFFSTKDERLAKSFYQDVQRWRSWHLVHVMGKTQKPVTLKMDHTAAQPRSTENHQRRASGNLAINGLGSHKPLVSSSRFERLDHGVANTVNPPPRSMLKTENLYEVHQALDHAQLPSRLKTKPPVSFPKKFTKDPETGAPTTGQYRPNLAQESPRMPEPETFAASGLLGSQYQERFQAQQQPPSTNPSSFSPQKALYTAPQHPQTSPTRAASIRAAQPGGHHTSPTRKGSPPQNLAKPLIDLTPKFYEPPQHVKRERRIVPERLPSSGLVEIATTPEVAINVPSATAWRRPGASNGEGAAVGHSNRHVTLHPDGHTHAQTNGHRRSNSHLHRRPTTSGEHGGNVPSQSLQRSPVKPAPPIPQPSIPSSFKVPAIPMTANSGQPLARRGTLKTVGGPLNKSRRKDESGN